MAVRIPIVTDFNGRGIKRAAAEFRQLDGTLAKTKYAFTKALVPMTAALGGLATVAVSSMNAAMQDQKAQVELARVLRATLGATEDQIAATEGWIAVQGRTLGITDDELRPAYAKLSRSIRDTSKVQRLLSLAFNISRGTGAGLQETVDALAKAYNGNFKSLRALAPELSALIKDGATADQVFAALGDTFRDSAAKYADTAAGRMEILRLRFSELYEQLGTAFLPAFEQLMPYFEDLAAWLEANPDKIAQFAQGVGDLARLFVDLGKIVKDVALGVTRAIEDIINVFVDAINLMVQQLNRLPFVNLPKVPNVDLDNSNKSAAGAGNPFGTLFQLPPGIQGPTLNSAFMPLPSGIQGPVAPLPGGLGPRGLFGRINQGMQNITVNVSSANPTEVVRALQTYVRTSGPVPITVRNP